MALRSKPSVLVPIRNRSGTTSYRVTVTIRGRQKKFVSRDQQEAVEKQMEWEAERLHGANAARAKFTFLSVEQLRAAEAAYALLGEGADLMAAVRHYVRQPPSGPVVTKTFGSALNDFLAARKPHLSKAQWENYRIRGAKFGRFVGDKAEIGGITSEIVTDWLRRLGVGRKTWNNYRGDLAAIYSWFCAPPRRWLASNPLLEVEKYGKRALAKGNRPRMEVGTCRALMGYLEAERPEWCTFFALALFAGVRPDMRNGEIEGLARGIDRDGAEKYYHNGYLHIPAEIAKDRDPRRTTVPSNLAAWLAKYPLTPKAVCPGDHKIYADIRRRYSIPHDGLRHTAITAHVAKQGSIALAAQEFGTSEGIIRTHYLSRMTREEADEFRAIVPTSGA